MKNRTLNFVDKFKYLLLIPIILVALSIIIGTIFNLNFDYDFQKVSNFSVKFNTTVTDSEYDRLEDNIDDILKENGFKDYRIERTGTGAQNSVLVKIANNDGSLDSKIENVKIVIEDTLLDNTPDITSSVVVTLSDTSYSLPKNVSSMIWFSILAITCIAIFVFFYNWYRYNIIAGATLALSIAIDTVMLLSAMIVFRIPFNYYFVVPFVIMILSTIINSTYINNIVKSTLNEETYAKYTNIQRIELCTSKAFKGITMYSSIIAILVLTVMFFGGPSLIYLGLAIVVGLIVSMFVSLFMNTSLWAMWYKKDKDKSLARRIALEKAREEKKNNKNKQEDEKIVV